jgi:hypothetical protein
MKRRIGFNHLLIALTMFVIGSIAAGCVLIMILYMTR